jgi:hypothetical protein
LQDVGDVDDQEPPVLKHPDHFPENIPHFTKERLVAPKPGALGPGVTDEFFREQVRQLQSKGHSPEAAAEIVVEAMRAYSQALRKLLERCENGEPLPELEGPPCGGDNDADVSRQAQP